MIEKILISGATSLALYFFMRSKFVSDKVDNALISTGLTQETESISMSSNTIAARNKNPLNIRESSDNWQGLAPERAKQGFFVFTDVYWCYRAAAKIILGAYKKRGVNTVEKIINAWAPPSENKTEDYILFVTKKSGLKRTDEINKQNINKLLYAMTIIESGVAQSYDVIDKGVALS